MKKLLTIAAMTLAASSVAAQPLFPNSVVSNDIDFITTDDHSAFYCLHYLGTDRREMPDKRHDELFADGVHVFEALFTDGTVIEITAHPDFGTEARAADVAAKLTGPLGRLPTFMREKLGHVVLQKGDETAFAESRGRFFTVYDENMSKRIGTHDLEETVFHESVHAAMDVPVATDPEWLAAQSDDAAFVTEYAASLPEREDLAETALFAYAFFRHPERLDDQLLRDIKQTIPNRLAYLERFFGPSLTLQHEQDGLPACPD